MTEVEGSSQLQSSAPQPSIGGKKVVTFDIFGSPVGEQSDKFTSFVGRCVRTHISVAYETWKSVPQGLKEALWEAITDEYEVPSRWRKKIEARAGYSWRDQRDKLRASKILKHTRHLDEIKKDVPPHIRNEDWAKFVDQTFTLKALKKRVQVQVARSKNIALHRTGRTGAARTRYKMIEKTEVFIRIHTSRKGIGRNEELDRKLGRVREIVENNLSNVSFDVDNDLVAEIFGKDSRGRVYGYVSAILRVALKSMQPIIDKLGQQNESHPIEKQTLRDMVRDIIQEDFGHHLDIRSPTSAYFQTWSVNEQNHTSGNVTDVNLRDMMGSVVAIGRATLPEGEVGPMRCDVVLDMVLEPNAPVALDPAKRIMTQLDVGAIIKWPTILVAKRSI